MMKKLALIMMTSAMLFACKDETKISISGKFENVGTIKKVYLLGVKNNQMAAIDSTNVSENGEFEFVKDASNPDFYHISITDHQYVLVLNNGDEVSFKADLADKNMAYSVEGGKESERLMKFNVLRNQLMQKIVAVQTDFDKQQTAMPAKRDSLIEAIRPAYLKATEEMNKGLVAYAFENANSLVGFYAINLVDKSRQNDLISYVNKIGTDIKNVPVVVEFVNKMQKLKNLQIGQIAPDFTIQSIDNKTIKLSDFRKKYVLLDFWASWCGPCRGENPNVVVAYNRFKDKNFTVLGISLDKNKEEWVQAVKADNLTWAHGSELKDFEGEIVKLYQIESIPSNFLLDPSGKIIAKDLRESELLNFLAKTLK
ncbi:MAG: AhpC/TSA family protein [Sphingobacteriaceae bacterium]|nr:AhpC/TSA family protein [Sphingobacteriaceae bacterium]